MELGCCLSEFDSPNIMDIKMGEKFRDKIYENVVMQNNNLGKEKN